MTYSFLSASGIQPPTQSKSGMLQLRLCMFPKSWVRTSPRNAIEQVHDFQLATHDHKLVGQPFIRIFIDVVPAPPLVSACALIPKLAVTFIITHHSLQRFEALPTFEHLTNWLLCIHAVTEWRLCWTRIMMPRRVRGLRWVRNR